MNFGIQWLFNVMDWKKWNAHRRLTLQMNLEKNIQENIGKDPYKIYEDTLPLIEEWMRYQEAKEVEKIRLRFSREEPEIGDRCLLYWGKAVYFGTRTSQNYFQSGNLTIPFDTEGMMVVTLEEVNNKEVIDATDREG